MWAKEASRLRRSTSVHYSGIAYEDQQKMAESLNRRKSIFLTLRVHASSTTYIVRITLGSMKRSSPRLRSWSELSALGRYGPWRPPEYCCHSVQPLRCAPQPHGTSRGACGARTPRRCVICPTTLYRCYAAIGRGGLELYSVEPTGDKQVYAEARVRRGATVPHGVPAEPVGSLEMRYTARGI